jgi:hypothetical protein
MVFETRSSKPDRKSFSSANSDWAALPNVSIKDLDWRIELRVVEVILEDDDDDSVVVIEESNDVKMLG